MAADAQVNNLKVDGQITQVRTGNWDDPTHVIGGYRKAINNGQAQRSGNGAFKWDYFSHQTTITGFDCGFAMLSIYDQEGPVNGPMEGEWHVAVSPKDNTGNWTCFGVEMDIGNRAGDQGYRNQTGGKRSTGGLVIMATVPGAFDGVPYNVDFAICAGGGKAESLRSQFYNVLLIDRDTVAKGGRGIQARGDTGRFTDSTPYTAMEVQDKWQSGLRLEKANFVDNNAVTIANDDNIAKPNGKKAMFVTDSQYNKLMKLID